jgi:hypothetical protein
MAEKIEQNLNLIQAHKRVIRMNNKEIALKSTISKEDTIDYAFLIN